MMGCRMMTSSLRAEERMGFGLMETIAELTEQESQ